MWCNSCLIDCCGIACDAFVARLHACMHAKMERLDLSADYVSNLTCLVHMDPSSEIVVKATISDIVYQNIVLHVYGMGRLENAKMVEE